MKITSRNPANGNILKEFDAVTFEQAARDARRCRDVQREWADKPIEKRSEILANMAFFLREGLMDYAKLMTLEMGKPITQSKAEIEKCAWLCEFYAKSGAGFLAEEEIKTSYQKSYIRFDPLGVVLGIMPWNFPFWQVFRFAVPAILAGNGVLLKHASNVPQCASKIEEIFNASGFPSGLFKTLLIDAKTSGLIIESDNLIDAVSLTGSTEAGSQVASAAGKHIKKCVLELGGSDPFIVLADADLKVAAKTAVQARMQNAGQSCIAAKRFIVEESVAAEFEKFVVEEFKNLHMGDPMDESVNLGPVAKEEFKSSLQKQVDDSIKMGARLLAGGESKNNPAAFFEPTLLTNVTRKMPVCSEEVFGPVMPLIIVKDEKEAIDLANDSEYGLGASVWTADIKKGEEFARKINSGFVSVNGMVKSDPRLPFGGVKKSGFGRELGSYGIKEFVNIKTVVIN